ncbi:hypothetical protein [Aquimarina sp. AU474]|uniref:hypothetical protein n=1 Tax=Aquimarina sp. AU474 TaxID=2108529 RepID=UPI000D68E584|nr:hypothetical protein [Aquimarina sp. AU474]
MTHKKPIADLHCHPSIKPFRNKEQFKNIWVHGRNKEPKDYFKTISIRKWIINAVLKKMATFSQSNLDDCYKGGNRLVFCSIYPFERPFLRPDRPFSRAKRFHRFALKVLFRKKVYPWGIKIDVKISSLLSGGSLEWLQKVIDRIHRDGVEYIKYYDEYIKERDFIFNYDNTTSPNTQDGVTPKFCLVKNYEELQTKKNKDVICGVFTVEGIHSFAKYKRSNLLFANSIDDLSDNDQNRLKREFTNNIVQVKKQKYPPFFITLSHHFNSLVAGHAASFADHKFIQPGFKDIFNQLPGMNTGITSFGEKLIREYLLSREHGPRILIDTKHMSIKARRRYYEMINEIRKDDSLHENIPIISSHTAVSGISTLQKAEEEIDSRPSDKHSFVSRYDINITNEDIIETFKSDGLIGICMHDGRMPGGKFRKKIKQAGKDRKKLKKLHVQMFLTNVFHIVKVNLNFIRVENENRVTSKIEEKDAWKIIGLGSDNDGIVDPFDHYDTAADLTDFKMDIVNFIDNYDHPDNHNYKIITLGDNERKEGELSGVEIQGFLLGQTAAEVADRVFYNNTDMFLSKYFTQHYLESVVPDLVV